MTRSTVQDYVLAADLNNSLQGPIAFDENGDIKQRTCFGLSR